MKKFNHIWWRYFHLWIYGLVDEGDNLYGLRIFDEKNPSPVGDNAIARLQEKIGGGGFLDLGNGGEGFMRKLPPSARVGDYLPVCVDRYLPHDKGIRVTHGWHFQTRYVSLATHRPHTKITKDYEDLWQGEAPTHCHVKILAALGHIKTTERQEVVKKDFATLQQQWQEAEKLWQSNPKPQMLPSKISAFVKAFARQIPIKATVLFADDNFMRQAERSLQDRHLSDNFRHAPKDIAPAYHLCQELLQPPITFGEGGRLWVNETQAAVVIDVDSATITANSKGGMLEINLQAAEAVMRIIGAMNLGGVILVDFIRMQSPQDRRRLLERLRGLSKKYHVGCDVLGYSLSGFVEILRRRHSLSLPQTLTHNPSYLGLMVIGHAMQNYKRGTLHITAPQSVITHLQIHHKDILAPLPLTYKADDSLDFPVVETV